MFSNTLQSVTHILEHEYEENAKSSRRMNYNARASEDPVRHRTVRKRRYNQRKRCVRKRSDRQHTTDQVQDQYREPLRAKPYPRNLMSVVFQAHHLREQV